MKLLIYSTMLFVLFLCISCAKKVSKTELLKYIQEPENGLHLSQSVNGIDISLTYWPQELVAWQSTRNIDTLNNNIWVEKCEQYQQYHYLKLQLSIGAGELLHAYVQNQPKYSQLVNELSFRMASKAFLISQPCDTLLFVDSYAPRFYGVNSSTELMLIFSNEKELKNDLRFELKDLGLGTGDIQFRIHKGNLKSIPNLFIQDKLN